MQALIEGVALRVAETVASIEAIQPITGLSVDGGMARNDYLLGFLAGLMRGPVFRAPEVETTALGLIQMALAGQGQDDIAPVPRPGAIRADAEARIRAPDRLARFALVREGIAALARQMG